MDNQKHINDNFSGLILNLEDSRRKIIFALCAVLCLTPFISPAAALVMGLVVAQFSGHPYLHLNHKATHLLLQLSVVGLGFGMNLHSAFRTGKEGVIFTIISIAITLAVGYGLGKVFRIEKKTSFLISCGTAICGGSAIAAVSPVIKAEEKQISVALGCVFILNSVALIIFPVVGHYFNLSETQFAMWCALAIHDTSSVVGAAGKYGNHALEIATTVKLTRALWIVPVAFISGYIFKNSTGKISVPYFIAFFVLAMVVSTYISQIAAVRPILIYVSKAGLTLTLFLIGAGLSRKVLTSIGFKPLFAGLLLWLLISAAALYAVIHLV
ncbi:YeiH family protein [Dyadobacter sp. CY356]|uniref:YeiH family protein n=1 Tax=Dyadobacter sp. CY356 TaxID=2906442 RepID=UPI001F16903E|nr:putative sulfate exporter family transporter [Dyadobacter sp. CY356]MCF0054931.1 putative sulfate exporter family transporter [Dyadobacter sp. CY356]